MKVKIRVLIDIMIYTAFCIIILLSVAAITTIYIDNADARFEIQKRDVTIEALITSCKINWLIDVDGREEKKNE